MTPGEGRRAGSSPLRSDAPLERIESWAFTVPTEGPEADGTLEWEATTLVLVRVRGGGMAGIGLTYGHAVVADLVRSHLAPVAVGHDAMELPAVRERMLRSLRNVGRPGLASMAVSAVDVALWDLKARLLGVPLVVLLGSARSEVPAYGSGGFTTQSGEHLAERCRRWVAEGMTRVKVKVGSEPDLDVDRVRTAREALGPEIELFVDANGAYDRKQALALAVAFADEGVVWFEEPVSSDDLEGLRLLRDRAPPGMRIAAGEYGHDAAYFRRMLEAGAVDVLMPDATRCGGITGFLEAVALCRAFHVPVSAHCAPSVHLHPACAAANVRHVEYFFDHARIERLLFDGAGEPVDGVLRPDPSRPGLGLEFRWSDAEKFGA